MVWSFFGPFAHFLFDDAGVDPVTAWRQDFLGDFLYESLIPTLRFIVSFR